MLLSGGSWGGEEVVKAACEVAFEAAQRFASGLAFGELALQIELGCGVAARPRDGDDVQSVVELSVAAAV